MSATSKHVHAANKPAASVATVNWEDQQLINRFGRLHVKSLELDDQIAAKKIDFENIKDTASDIENLFDDDMCKIKVGEIYFEVSNEEALEFVEKKTAETTKVYNDLVSQREELQKELDTIKTKLKAKFGDDINVD